MPGSGGGHRDPPEARLPRAPALLCRGARAPSARSLPLLPVPCGWLRHGVGVGGAGCGRAGLRQRVPAGEQRRVLARAGASDPRPWPCPTRRPLRSLWARPVANSTPRLGRPRWAWTGRSGPGLGFEAAAGRAGLSATSGGGKTSARPRFQHFPRRAGPRVRTRDPQEASTWGHSVFLFPPLV